MKLLTNILFIGSVSSLGLLTGCHDSSNNQTSNNSNTPQPPVTERCIVNQQIFEQIKQGLTYEAANKLIGCKGILITEDNYKPTDIDIFTLGTYPLALQNSPFYMWNSEDKKHRLIMGFWRSTKGSIIQAHYRTEPEDTTCISGNPAAGYNLLMASRAGGFTHRQLEQEVGCPGSVAYQNKIFALSYLSEGTNAEYPSFSANTTYIWKNPALKQGAALMLLVSGDTIANRHLLVRMDNSDLIQNTSCIPSDIEAKNIISINGNFNKFKEAFGCEPILKSYALSTGLPIDDIRFIYGSISKPVFSIYYPDLAYFGDFISNYILPEDKQNGCDAIDAQLLSGLTNNSLKNKADLDNLTQSCTDKWFGGAQTEFYITPKTKVGGSKSGWFVSDARYSSPDLDPQDYIDWTYQNLKSQQDTSCHPTAAQFSQLAYPDDYKTITKKLGCDGILHHIYFKLNP